MALLNKYPDSKLTDELKPPEGPPINPPAFVLHPPKRAAKKD